MTSTPADSWILCRIISAWKFEKLSWIYCRKLSCWFLKIVLNIIMKIILLIFKYWVENSWICVREKLKWLGENYQSEFLWKYASCLFVVLDFQLLELNLTQLNSPSNWKYYGQQTVLWNAEVGLLRWNFWEIIRKKPFSFPNFCILAKEKWLFAWCWDCISTW